MKTQKILVKVDRPAEFVIPVEQVGKKTVYAFILRHQADVLLQAGAGFAVLPQTGKAYRKVAPSLFPNRAPPQVPAPAQAFKPAPPPSGTAQKTSASRSKSSPSESFFNASVSTKPASE